MKAKMELRECQDCHSLKSLPVLSKESIERRETDEYIMDIISKDKNFDIWFEKVYRTLEKEVMQREDYNKEDLERAFDYAWDAAITGANSRMDYCEDCIRKYFPENVEEFLYRKSINELKTI